MMGWIIVALIHEGRLPSFRDDFMMFVTHSVMALLAAFISHAGQGSSQEVVGLQAIGTLETSASQTGLNLAKRTERDGMVTVTPWSAHLLMGVKINTSDLNFDLKKAAN